MKIELRNDEVFITLLEDGRAIGLMRVVNGDEWFDNLYIGFSFEAVSVLVSRFEGMRMGQREALKTSFGQVTGIRLDQYTIELTGLGYWGNKLIGRKPFLLDIRTMNHVYEMLRDQDPEAMEALAGKRSIYANMTGWLVVP